MHEIERGALDFIEAIKRHTGVTFDEIRSRRRSEFLVNARSVLAWCLRRHGYSYNEIGVVLRGREGNHATALHLFNRAALMVASSKTETMKFGAFEYETSVILSLVWDDADKARKRRSVVRRREGVSG